MRRKRHYIGWTKLVHPARFGPFSRLIPQICTCLTPHVHVRARVHWLGGLARATWPWRGHAQAVYLPDRRSSLVRTLRSIVLHSPRWKAANNLPFWVVRLLGARSVGDGDVDVVVGRASDPCDRADPTPIVVTGVSWLGAPAATVQTGIVRWAPDEAWLKRTCCRRVSPKQSATGHALNALE